MTEKSTSHCLTQIDAIKAGRALWLSAAHQSDLEEVERLYRSVLSTSSFCTATKDSAKSAHIGQPPKKKSRNVGHIELDRSSSIQARQQLCLLLCQSGRYEQVQKNLFLMGFKCKLAQHVLDYPTSQVMTTDYKGKHPSSSPCQIIDGFLTASQCERLRSVFESPTANYWISHRYEVEPPSPYFSYVVPLSDIQVHGRHSTQKYGFIGDLIHKVICCPMLAEKFPNLPTKAKFVELWAHNRPHASGHQMHFDSDDEGHGGVKNPIISTILYITAGCEGESSNDLVETLTTGGPSLVTNQKLGDTHLATKGWLIHPQSQRLVVFDGKYLHGVIPGKGFCPTNKRRVTLMFAVWQDIQIRRGNGPGSARPFPIQKENVSVPEWAKKLIEPMNEENDLNRFSYQTCIETAPIELDCVYETLDGEPWDESNEMPLYDEVFQGF